MWHRELLGILLLSTFTASAVEASTIPEGNDPESGYDDARQRGETVMLLLLLFCIRMRIFVNAR